MTSNPTRFASSAALVLALAAAAAPAAEPLVLPSAGPQPAADALAPGLAPVYFYGTKFNWVHEFQSWPPEKGEPGPPLLVVNYRTGVENVLTSNDKDWVGARISGYIHLDTPGVYQMAFESNDGVRLEIADQLVVEDPDVHPDQFSDVGTVEIAEPGWYPLVIWYFEKWNTSTLRFLWKEPGAEPNQRMKLVPGTALAHVPAE